MKIKLTEYVYRNQHEGYGLPLTHIINNKLYTPTGTYPRVEWNKLTYRREYAKYGCPNGHISITKVKHGKHAGMYYCQSCGDWFADKKAR